MSSIARKVNQQLVYAQQLLADVCDDGGIKRNALLSGAYLQLELALLLYLFEVAGQSVTKAEQEKWLTVSTLAGIIEDQGFVAGLRTLESKELLSLCASPGSWLSIFITQLRSLRAPFKDSDDTLQASIFSADEEPPSATFDLLSVTELVGDDESPSAASLKGQLAQFKELVARHRSINEEY